MPETWRRETGESIKTEKRRGREMRKSKSYSKGKMLELESRVH